MAIEQILERVQRETVRWGDEKFNEGVNLTIAAIRMALAAEMPKTPARSARSAPAPSEPTE